MESLEDLRDLSDEILESIKDSYPDGIKCLLNSSAPHTGRALVSLVSKTGFLSNAIFDIAETDNPYCVKILFRSLVEHYLKSQYLWTRHIADKTDEVGSEYFEFCDLMEIKEMISAQNKVARIIHPNVQEIRPFDWIREQDPNLAKFSNEDIRQKAAQFKYGKIIEFLLGKIYRNATLAENNFLLGIIPSYSELSTFVHGGPSSDKYILSTQESVRKRESYEMTELALLMATHVKYGVYVLLFNLDKRFEKPCAALSNLMRSMTRKEAI